MTTNSNFEPMRAVRTAKMSKNRDRTRTAAAKRNSVARRNRKKGF